MTQVQGDAVIKYDVVGTTSAECSVDITEAQGIYLTDTGTWAIATGATVSTLATHIAATDGSATPSGDGNDTSKQLTGFKYGTVRLASALANVGGWAFQGDTAGAYADVPGTQSQRLGVIVDTNGKTVQIDIAQVNNHL